MFIVTKLQHYFQLYLLSNSAGKLKLETIFLVSHLVYCDCAVYDFIAWACSGEMAKQGADQTLAICCRSEYAFVLIMYLCYNLEQLVQCHQLISYKICLTLELNVSLISVVGHAILQKYFIHNQN